jgi:hypothetical protein
MSKHLQRKQMEEIFSNEEDLLMLPDENLLPDPDGIDEEEIYEIIDHNSYGEINMNELELDDYDDLMQL